jgi:hypothetical protein
MFINEFQLFFYSVIYTNLQRHKFIYLVKMLETYINEFLHLYCSSFLKITETEVFLFQKKPETGNKIKCLEPHSSIVYYSSNW